MAKIFMPDMDAKERLLIMQQNADQIKTEKYFKPLTEEEIVQRMGKLTDNAIKFSELEDEKKESMAEFKVKMDPLSKENKFLLTEIKTRQTQVDGTLFLMADHESGMMETYDESGELVGSRRLYPDEKQGRVPFLKKVAD